MREKHMAFEEKSIIGTCIESANRHSCNYMLIAVWNTGIIESPHNHVR